MTTTSAAVKFNTPNEQLKASMAPSLPHIASIIGTWVNVNAATRDIVRVVLSEQGGGLHVHAYGACLPTPCDWGDVAGQAYAASVSGGTTVAFSASDAFGFKTTILTGHLDGVHLIVEDFNVFEDGSGRSSYFAQGTFKKQ